MKKEDYLVKGRTLTLTFIFGFIFIVISPLLFTLPQIFSWISFSSTGEIGDTIGGITSPIVGVLGALLVYYSFLAQQKANKLQFDMLSNQIKQSQKEDNYSKINELIQFCITEINNLEITEGESKKIGVKAVESFVNQYPSREQNPKDRSTMLSSKISEDYNTILVFISKIIYNLNFVRSFYKKEDLGDLSYKLIVIKALQVLDEITFISDFFKKVDHFIVKPDLYDYKSSFNDLLFFFNDEWKNHKLHQ